MSYLVNELPCELVALICSFIENFKDITNFLIEVPYNSERIYEDLVKLRFPNDYLGVRTILNDCHFTWKDTYEELINNFNDNGKDKSLPGHIYDLYKKYPRIYEILIEKDTQFGYNNYILYSEIILDILNGKIYDVHKLTEGILQAILIELMVKGLNLMKHDT